jgi:hypothetical protein
VLDLPSHWNVTTTSGDGAEPPESDIETVFCSFSGSCSHDLFFAVITDVFTGARPRGVDGHYSDTEHKLNIEVHYHLARATAQSDTSSSTFQRNILPPSAGSNSMILHLGSLFDLEDEGRKLRRNVNELPPDYTASNLRREYFS